jgi:hypothetical protein
MKNLCLVIFGAIGVLLVAACGDGTQSVNNSASSPSPQSSSGPPARPTESATVAAKVDPERLISLVKQIQTEYVRDSTGIQAHECFTKDDFNQFVKDKKTAEIVERLRNDNDFRNLVSAIRDLSFDKRSDLFSRASNTYRRAWRELKLNPETASADELRKGQTDEGMQAEKLIAQAVVNLVRQMLSSS